ncbi:MAG: PIN domain-containing protein [Gemmatimonadales bacterium]
MSVAYVDTSCLVAIAFGERGATAIERRLREFDEIVSANLLEAELRCAFKRESVEFATETLSGVSWLIPDRPLTSEIARVLDVGYVRGADCWHIASALFLEPEPSSVTFLTLDEMQRKIAKELGFAV